MGQLRKLFASLTLRQKLTIAVVAVLVLVGLSYTMHWRKEQDFKALYTGLAAEDSAAVVQKIKESGTEYRLSESGDVISVPSARVADLRIELAGAGLPKTGRIGFEIFDKSNLGATEFVEHVNYRRALEGELERSVSAMTEVEQARVHVTFPKESVFLESREPAKASVIVKLKPGNHLSARNVTALTHLLSSAVEGLNPDAVSVLDMQGNLLSKPRPSSPDEAANEAALDYRQKVEHDLLQKIATTLDPLLGHEKYRASVSVDCDLTSGEQSEESLDPERSVMVSSQKTEEASGSGLTAGIPGTASNLPRPTSRPAGSGNSTTHRTENITYQTSRTVRTTKIPQGAVRKISIALLLDQAVRWEGAGNSAQRLLVPPTPETLKSIQDVVTAAVGFTANRDQITVESLPFEETLNRPAPEAPQPVAHPTPSVGFDWRKQMPMVIGAAVGLAIVLAIGIYALLRSRRRTAQTHAEAEVPNKALPSGKGPSTEIGSNAIEAQLEARMAERAAEQEKADLAALAAIKVPPVKTKKAEVLAKQLKENAKKDPSSSAHILQAWIHDRT
ncbi:MAG: flagellar basal-body MS-ring/collar protein FliF [Ignavibacteriota bacterium]